MKANSNDFISTRPYTVTNEKVTETCPSNIALIKYWGKYPGQIPANPSISYTLNHCRTETSMEFTAGAPFSVRTFLGDAAVPPFAKKIENYFRQIEGFLPWVLKGSYVIRTQNTFPHSSGIASSASGFGALAKCLMELETRFSGGLAAEFAAKKISFLARLGSGSACRSIYPGLVVWGETDEVNGSSDLFAVPYPTDAVHAVFKNYNDWVLLIHEGEKAVSSTVGHGLMESNPYASQRFKEAHHNFARLKVILREGNQQEFFRLVEHEALTLHAMMMMSDPAFILMKSGTLKTIEKIWKFRAETALPITFTLDAGANVHVLFPTNEDTEKVTTFITTELLPLTQQGGVVKDTIRF